MFEAENDGIFYSDTHCECSTLKSFEFWNIKSFDLKRSLFRYNRVKVILC